MNPSKASQDMWELLSRYGAFEIKVLASLFNSRRVLRRSVFPTINKDIKVQDVMFPLAKQTFALGVCFRISLMSDTGRDGPAVALQSMPDMVTPKEVSALTES